MSIKTAIVVAMAKNNCIGKDNDLPWHIPADLKRFKALTLGKPVIMGRKTFQSIYDRLGKPLPGRQNIVVSRTGVDVDGVINCSSLEDAIEAAKEIAARDGQDEIIIGGGAQIYTQALALADRMYLTIIDQNVDGDAFFPEYADADWQETTSEDNAAEGDLPCFTYVDLARL